MDDQDDRWMTLFSLIFNFTDLKKHKRELRITSAILQAVLMMEAFFLHNTKTWMLEDRHQLELMDRWMRFVDCLGSHISLEVGIASSLLDRNRICT